MPWKLAEADGGWYVEDDKGKRFSKKPLSRKRALAQMRALYANEPASKEIGDQMLASFKRMMDPNTGGGVDRDKLAASDFVDPERRRFPIVTPGDVMDAVHSYGRAKPPIPFDEFKRRVTAICKRKGAEFVAQLPKVWGVEAATKSIGSVVESEIHSNFTRQADDWYGAEKVTREERIILSSAIGDALEAFVKRIEKDAPQLYSRQLWDVSNTSVIQPSIVKEHQPSLIVYKDSTGADRWVTFSSNAYRDRDKEIVSTAALEADVERADKEQNYGPLRWWHVGKPDPINQTPGPGVDIGTCDFNAMHGRVLIESGTFKNTKIAQAVKEAAPGLQVSIGYFHPRTEPDGAGVFNTIKRFERSLLPAGRASNPFTGMPVIQKSDGGTEMISEKIKAFAALLKDDELVQSILAQAEQKEKEAQELGTTFKGEEPETPPAAPEQPAVEVEAVAGYSEKADTTDAEDAAESEPDDNYEPVIGDMTPDAFAGMLAEAMGKALEPYQAEIKALKASMTKKDDSEAALREALELQAQTVKQLKSQLDELTGSQPRAATKGYRDSQSADTVVKDDSKVKGLKPTVDPDFVKMFIP